MKKLISLLIAFLICITLCVSTLAIGDEITVLLNNMPIEFDVKPQIIMGRTMVPIRAIFENMGANVEWDEATRSAISTKDDTVVKMTVDSTDMYINDEAHQMDVSPVVIDGRTLAPARYVAEAFGANVSWDEETRTVIITNSVENRLTMYALDGRTIEVPEHEVDAYLNVGWFETIEETQQTLYAADGRTITVYKAEVDAYLNVGWYRTLAETKQTLYAADGRTITVYKAEVPAYLNVGWYESASAAQSSKPVVGNSTSSSSSYNPAPNGNYYRTPTGSKYHLDPNCGGKNSYKTSNIAGLSPCSKCAK